MLEDYVLVAKAAEELGVSRHAIYKSIKRGTLKASRVGPTVLIHKAEWERFKATERHRGWPKGKPRGTKKS
jgi:excisionase family DNA binding protein